MLFKSGQLTTRVGGGPSRYGLLRAREVFACAEAREAVTQPQKSAAASVCQARQDRRAPRITAGDYAREEFLHCLATVALRLGELESHLERLAVMRRDAVTVEQQLGLLRQRRVRRTVRVVNIVQKVSATSSK